MQPDLATIDETNVAHSKFLTYSYETDCFSDARLAFYFQVVQEAAGVHAALRGCSIPAMHTEGKTWVITRSHMEVNRYTKWPEELVVETWAQEPIRLHLPRVVRAFDRNNRPLFTAKTYWAILDLESGRPCRPLDMSKRIGIPPQTDSIHTFDMALPKLTLSENELLTRLTTYKPTIGYLDTDRNQHVNNISYLNWALESLPSSFRNRFKVCKADVAYLRQTFLGDDLMVITSSRDDKAMLTGTAPLEHQIFRTERDGSKMVVWEGTTWWNLREDLR